MDEIKDENTNSKTTDESKPPVIDAPAAAPVVADEKVGYNLQDAAEVDDAPIAKDFTLPEDASEELKLMNNIIAAARDFVAIANEMWPASPGALCFTYSELSDAIDKLSVHYASPDNEDADALEQLGHEIRQTLVDDEPEAEPEEVYAWSSPRAYGRHAVHVAQTSRGTLRVKPASFHGDEFEVDHDHEIAGRLPK